MDYLSQINWLPFISSFAGAFFAFLFFVFGQTWISSLMKREELIVLLERLNEFVALQIYQLEMNLLIIKSVKEINESVGIFLKRFTLFHIEKFNISKMLKYKVVGDVLKFVVHLEVANDNVNMLNNTIDVLNDFSKVAILENRVDFFNKLLGENIIVLKDNSEKFSNQIKIIKDKIDPITREIHFAIWYSQLKFWEKWYFLVRVNFCSEYKDKKKEKLFKKHETKNKKTK